jgi:hypothetical protein
LELQEILNPPNDFDDLPEITPEFPSGEQQDPTRLTGVEQEEFKALLYEIASRQSESLKLFKPLPTQEAFFASEASERLAIGGNRGGKTTVTVVEIARVVTGRGTATYRESTPRWLASRRPSRSRSSARCSSPGEESSATTA